MKTSSMHHSRTAPGDRRHYRAYLGARNRPKWREFLTEFLIIDGVVQVLDVQIYALKQRPDCQRRTRRD